MRPVLVVMLILLGLTGSALGQAKGYGAGLEFEGDLGMSLTGKYWLSGTTAITASLAGSGISADYLFHQKDRFIDKQMKGALHYGAGVQITFSENDQGGIKTDLSVRVPLGMDYYLKQQPVDIFWSLVPSFGSDGIRIFNSEWGIRYFL